MRIKFRSIKTLKPTKPKYESDDDALSIMVESIVSNEVASLCSHQDMPSKAELSRIGTSERKSVRKRSASNSPKFEDDEEVLSHFVQHVVADEATDVRELLYAQSQYQQMALESMWTTDGVAKFNTNMMEEDKAMREHCDALDWEMNTPGPVGGQQSHPVIDADTSLARLLQQTDEDDLLDGFPSTANLIDDEDSMSSCSENSRISAYSAHSAACSIFSMASAVSFESSISAKSSHTSGKRQLRALAAYHDPKMKEKIKNRRGLWSGCFDDEDEVYEKSIEVVWNGSLRDRNAGSENEEQKPVKQIKWERNKREQKGKRENLDVKNEGRIRGQKEKRDNKYAKTRNGKSSTVERMDMRVKRLEKTRSRQSAPIAHSRRRSRSRSHTPLLIEV